MKEEYERAKLWMQLTGLVLAKKLLGGKKSNEFVKLSKRNAGSFTGPCHQKRIGLGNCRFCADKEKTPEHLLCECDGVSYLFGSRLLLALKLGEEL